MLRLVTLGSLALILLLFSSGHGGPVANADGETFTVTKIADTADGNCDADCSLREAVIAGNSSSDAVIEVPLGRYPLTLTGPGEDSAGTGDLDITSNVTIIGSGSASESNDPDHCSETTCTIIDGIYPTCSPACDRVLDIHTSAPTGIEVRVQNLEVRNGYAESLVSPTYPEGHGGGVIVRSNVIADLERISIVDNVADNTAGGIHVALSASVVIRDSQVRRNSLLLDPTSGFTLSCDDQCWGMAISNHGNLLIERSTVAYKVLDGDPIPGVEGGGIWTTGALVISDSIMEENHGYEGAAVKGLAQCSVDCPGSQDGVLVLNSTFRNNGPGQSIYEIEASVLNSTFVNDGMVFSSGAQCTIGSGPAAVIRNSTIVDSDLGCGLAVGNSIIANTPCANGTPSLGWNITYLGPCSLAGTNDTNGVNPLLEEGLSTRPNTYSPTFALLSGSPAISAGEAASCTGADQGGQPRLTSGTACDRGAYEYCADDTDSDLDGAMASCDPCPTSEDCDSDGVSDGRLGVGNVSAGPDNCPQTSNQNQSDLAEILNSSFLGANFMDLISTFDFRGDICDNSDCDFGPSFGCTQDSYLDTNETPACVLVPQFWATPSDDADCDGFASTVGPQLGRASESFMSTVASAKCASTPAANDEANPDRWPADFNDDRISNSADYSTFGPHWNKQGPNPPYSARHDVNQDNWVNLSDLVTLGAFNNKSCAP